VTRLLTLFQCSATFPFHIYSFNFSLN